MLILHTSDTISSQRPDSLCPKSYAEPDWVGHLYGRGFEAKPCAYRAPLVPLESSESSLPDPAPAPATPVAKALEW